MTNRHRSTVAAVLGCLLLEASAGAIATTSPYPNLDKVLNASSQAPAIPDGIPEVRAQALKQLAVGLGMRAGLADESKKIVEEIDAEKDGFDQRFNFGALTFSNGALPPVIEEAKDVIAVTEYSMRVQGKVYRIVSPTTMIPTNWRNYLYLGLNESDDPIVGDAQRSVLPKDSAEKAYWDKIVRQAHSEGRQQARKVFQLNLKRLERDYFGMRMFYQLYERGLVSAPKFAVATESVARPDPNTIVIGDSIFRVTSQPAFNGDSSKWKVSK